MRYTTFFLLSFALFYNAYDSSSWWATWLFVHSGAAALGVALAYSHIGPIAFLKQTDGALFWPSWAIFWPYHLIDYAVLGLKRIFSREPPWHEIVPGLYLGRRPLPIDRDFPRECGIRAVLDLTSEFSEPRFLREAGHYLCIPLLDSTAPTPGQLEFGVRWIDERLKEGPVYVHCAAGHGRSALFVMGWLLAAGKADSAEEAFEFVRRIRPGVHFKPSQRAALEAFAKGIERRD